TRREETFHAILPKSSLQPLARTESTRMKLQIHLPSSRRITFAAETHPPSRADPPTLVNSHPPSLRAPPVWQETQSQRAWCPDHMLENRPRRGRISIDPKIAAPRSRRFRRPTASQCAR